METTLHFLFHSKEATEAAQHITNAVQQQQMFGLMSKSKKNVVVFSIEHLKSWWVLPTGQVQVTHTYETEKQFIEAISMQLLSHKLFVQPQQQIADHLTKLLTNINTK